MRKLAVVFAVVILLAGCGRQGNGDKLLVAAASDLDPALREIAREFEKNGAMPVQITFGASGTLFAQIRNGAPFHVYLAADHAYPAGLVEGGQARAPIVCYAKGRLALFVQKITGVDAAQAGMKAVTHPRVRRVAIANPEHAPYGSAAVRALEHYKLRPRELVRAESAAQAAQYAHTGQVEAALLPMSHTGTLRELGTIWQVPAEAHEPILQCGAVLRGRASEGEPFLRFLTSSRSREILERYGFEPVGSAP